MWWMVTHFGPAGWRAGRARGARATDLRGDNLLLDVHSYQWFGGGWAAASVADISRTWEPARGHGSGFCECLRLGWLDQACWRPDAERT